MALLFVAQAASTLAFLPRITLEDAAESIRSPYWWGAHHTIYNGISSNVAYYASLAAAYRIFGFSLFLAKWLRLAMHGIGLLCLADLLRRYLTPMGALLPLLVMGLSPTWLFFNTNQSVYGLDLQYAPILLWFAFAIPVGRTARSWGACFLFGAGFLWAALSYPTTLFYFPSLATLLLFRWRKANPAVSWSCALPQALAIALGMAAPLAAFLLAAKDPALLVYDPAVGAGILRGGGGGFTLDADAVFDHARTVLADLFFRGGSYMFDIPAVDFGGPTGWIATSLLAVGAALWIKRAWRDPLLLWFAGSLVVMAVAPQFVLTYPGMRRSTGILFAAYGLLACGWKAARELPAGKRLWVAAGLAALTGAHALGDITNFEYGRKTSREATLPWFADDEGPSRALEHWDAFTLRGGVLPCKAPQVTMCRYAELYGALEGLRRWSGRPQLPILAWDPEKNREQVLDVSLWETRVWPE